ncbi:MAG: AIR synthase family protein [Chloroflexota bacterium]
MGLPIGKLPPGLLASVLERHRPIDSRLVLGPGIGLDCAVIEFGNRLLVAKSDPITFTAEDIGWYAVHVNANDVATTGAQPRWFLATLFLPESCQPALVEAIFTQIADACRQVGASLVGGHSEITAGLDRPIIAGTMLGEVAPERLITPRGARPGDCLLLTKGVPVEGGTILAREFAWRLEGVPEETLARARDYLRQPGISVVREALAAAEAGGVSAMHDPTEGGLAGGLWEMAEAAGVAIEVDLSAVPILPEAGVLCQRLGLDPLATIASGALLIAVRPESTSAVLAGVERAGVTVREIGRFQEGTGVWVTPITTEAVLAMRSGTGRQPLPRPTRDALASLFDTADRTNREDV